MDIDDKQKECVDLAKKIYSTFISREGAERLKGISKEARAKLERAMEVIFPHYFIPFFGW